MFNNVYLQFKKKGRYSQLRKNTGSRYVPSQEELSPFKIKPLLSIALIITQWHRIQYFSCFE